MKSKAEYVRRNRIKIGFMSVISGLLLTGCVERDHTYYPVDHQAPPVPTGVTSTTMDEAVLVSWDLIAMDPNHDDLAAYLIYRSNDNATFTHIATVDPDVSEYLDEGLVNGRTYFYAISSIDFDDNESELSRENVYDTPRPEGFDQVVYTYTDLDFGHLSGFDFSTEGRLPWDNSRCDFFLEYDATPGVETFYLWLGANGSRFQDMGYTDSFDDITYAPSNGWSVFDYIEVIPGHTYVILTEDNHYAKVRVTELFYNPTDGIMFDWGYQVSPGNRELKIEPPASESNNAAGTEVM